MPKKLRERRRRGDGGVTVAKRDEKGKPILWKASISLGSITVGGKRKRNRPTEYAETEAEAYVLLKQMQARYLSGGDMAPAKQTVEAFLLRWLEHVRAVCSIGTWMVYESHCRVHIIPAIGYLKLGALKTTHVQAMLDRLAATKAPSLVRNIRGTLSKALSMARKWGEVKVNVATDTEIAPVVQKRPPSLSEAQLDRLLDTISGHPLEPLVLVALGTGLRISELLGLLWAGVSYDTHELHITGAIKEWKRGPDAPYELVRDTYTKTRDERTTYLAEGVADAFRRQWERQQQQRQQAGSAWQMTGLVFTDDQGRMLNPRGTSRRFKALATRAGLPLDFTFHSLRHSAATFLIKQGEQQRTVMEVLGHKNIRTTARYGTVLPEVTRDALDKHAERLTRRRSAK
jgi:integrase